MKCNLVEDVLDKILDLDSDFVEKLILKFFNDKKFFNKKIDDNKYHVLWTHSHFFAKFLHLSLEE